MAKKRDMALKLFNQNVGQDEYLPEIASPPEIRRNLPYVLSGEARVFGDIIDGQLNFSKHV